MAMPEKTTAEGVAGFADTCLILMDDDFELSEELLGQSVATVGNKDGWTRPVVRFHAYHQGTLSLHIAWKGETFLLTILIRENNLLVACSCNSADKKKLCLHAYRAIGRLIRDNPSWFRKYRSGGEVEFALRHAPYFYIKWEYNDLTIREKPVLKRVFDPQEAGASSVLKQLLQLPCAKNADTKAEWVSCYFLVQWPRRNLLPTLLPCLGRLTKDGTEIRQFGNFLSSLQAENTHLLTEKEVLLNRLSFQIWKAAEALPGTLCSEEKTMDLSKLEEWLALWKQALGLLKSQEHVFHCYLVRLRDLKNKPRKSRLRKIKIHSGEPDIRFTLTIKEAFYQFKVTARNPHGRPIRNADLRLPFFIRSGNDFFFLPSAKKAAIVEWMQKNGTVMTIFPEHFPLFEKEILQEIKKHYPVEILRQ